MCTDFRYVALVYAVWLGYMWYIRYFQTCSVVIFRFRVASPHVADHASHSPFLQLTVWQSHLTSRASDSGGCGHVCGRPLQSGLKTSTAVSVKFSKGDNVTAYITKRCLMEGDETLTQDESLIGGRSWCAFFITFLDTTSPSKEDEALFLQSKEEFLKLQLLILKHLFKVLSVL